jgi:hypothetical protein
VDSQPLRDDSAEGEAQYVHPLQAQRVQQLHHVAAEPVE